MADDIPGVKHVVKTCPIRNCKARAFVQVLVFEDAAKQKKVDALAIKKLNAAHRQLHKDGKHDD